MYYKHKNCIDVFIRVDDETFSYGTVFGSWLTQGVNSYWSTTESYYFNIKKEELINWKLYIPKGNYYVG